MFQLLGTFFIISLTGALSPGPLTTVAIVEGSRRGKWSGISIAVGHGLVEIVYVAAIGKPVELGQQRGQEPIVMLGRTAASNAPDRLHLVEEQDGHAAPSLLGQPLEALPDVALRLSHPGGLEFSRLDDGEAARTVGELLQLSDQKTDLEVKA